ncbi:CsbD family protein [Arthrobacter woluwensis]|uniref:CsbD family protein n=1 Tax=Arthrobacter woluwensis TaxID=156980 RepID=UPI003802B9AA
MGFGENIGDKAQEMTGKAKEAFGSATNNDHLEAEGHQDRAEASLDQAREGLSSDAGSDVDPGTPGN